MRGLGAPGQQREDLLHLARAVASRLKQSSRLGGPFAGAAAAPGWANPRLVPRELSSEASCSLTAASRRRPPGRAPCGHLQATPRASLSKRTAVSTATAACPRGATLSLNGRSRAIGLPCASTSATPGGSNGLTVAMTAVLLTRSGSWPTQPQRVAKRSRSAGRLSRPSFALRGEAALIRCVELRCLPGAFRVGCASRAASQDETGVRASFGGRRAGRRSTGGKSRARRGPAPRRATRFTRPWSRGGP